MTRKTIIFLVAGCCVLGINSIFGMSRPAPSSFAAPSPSGSGYDVYSVGAVAGVLPSLFIALQGQPITTWRTIYDAKALAAKTVEEFKELKTKALRYARINLMIRLLPLGSAGLMALSLQENQTAVNNGNALGKPDIDPHKIFLLAGAIGGVPAGLFAYSMIKSYRQSRKHVKHAEELYAILQSPAFKKEQGLSADQSWDIASRALVAAEIEAFKNSGALPGTKSIVGSMEREATGFKEVLNNLDAALNKALAAREKNKRGT